VLAELKVLLVEDDHGVLDAIAKSLGRYVGELYLATNGKEGLHIFSLYQPDIVITDIKMPVMDGITMAREIRLANSETPIIVVSAFIDAEFMINAIDLGVSQYLFKPIELGRLLSVLERCAQNYCLKRKVKQKTEELSASVKVLTDYKKAVDASAIVSKSDANNKIIEVNDAFCAILGYSRDEIVGKTYSLLAHPKESPETLDAIYLAISNKRIFNGVVRNVAKNGDTKYFHLTIAPIMDGAGAVLEYLDLRQDITAMATRHYVSELTSLPNRNALRYDLESAPLPALILVNLDGFSSINDVYGNKIGDKVLIGVGEALKRYLTEMHGNATVYKLSADEFGVLARDQSKCGGMREFVKNLLARLDQETFVFDGYEILISAKAGYSLSKTNATTKADMALRIAKREHKNAVCYEDVEGLEEEFAKNVKLVAKIKKAIDEDRIVPFFQPVVDLKTGAVVQYECLMRIAEDNGSFMEAREFLELARKTRQYSKMSRIMIEKSCEYFADKSYDFSLNLNADDVRNEETKKHLKRVIEKTGVARRFVAEFSQAEPLDSNFPNIAKFAKDIQSWGARVAIDDFGIGYLSFRNIIKLNADFVKIDGAIVANMDSDRNSLAYTEIIASFAEKLGADVIAKSASKKSIAQLAKRLGIGYAQGFLYSKPLGQIGAK
jgi:PAS domain S-box-containing protein